MRFIGHAFVDWYDTIAENIRYFHQVEEANAARIALLTGADPALVRRRGQELDLATARRIGLVKESLTIAWLECYREFAAGTGSRVDPTSEEAIRTACRTPYEVRQELLPGGPELLSWLWETGFEVTVWTAGVPPWRPTLGCHRTWRGSNRRGSTEDGAGAVTPGAVFADRH